VEFDAPVGENGMDGSGMDTVRFLMSANAGEAMKSISRVASGGELARIMLAMKNVLAENDDVDSLVFDEVDTGVSGRAARRVAEKLAVVATRKQVLCVTHLPQIAAMADVHFSVEKQETDGRTYTRVQRLDRAGRRDALAGITGGGAATEAMRKGAEELLSSAEAFKKTLG
jgi:DNA repair protein RecN (Recombination protein N)